MAASMSLAPSRAAAAAAAPARRVRACAAAAGMPSAEDGYRTLMASEAKQKLPMEWEDLPLPLNTYSNKKPFTGEVVSNERCVGPKATGETCNIVIRHNGDMPYWEGQSYGVIPPGENPKRPGKPNTVRLYSIASSRYGDYYDGMTATLCVRRATYWDPELGAEDPAGKVMLIPEGSEDKTHIMVATGTGIAPFRSYMKRMFKEQGMGLSSKWKFTGKAWLFMGVANSDA